MWLATKLAEAKPPAKLPDLAVAIRELGDPPSASLYRKLFERYPRVKRGPDEDMSNHFSRLKREDAAWRAKDTTEADRRAQDPRARVQEPDQDAKIPAWVSTPSAPAPSPASSLGMPQRIPGWFTGDAMDAPPPDYGTPPMSRRTPGAGYSPKYAPERPTHEEWVRGLADKGIFLDADGRRMTPEQMQLPHRPVRGHDIWESFTRPASGRHRAAQVVVAYVDDALAKVAGVDEGPWSDE